MEFLTNNLLIDNVSKSFSHQKEKKLNVLQDISLKINKGEFVAILGPSGCGKSTLLNLVAGFEKPDVGKIIYNKEEVKEPSPERAMVFQTSVLFPWLNVIENVMYGLKCKGQNKSEIKQLAKIWIRKVGMEGFENYYPDQLSGGMKQRIALARVFVLNPKVLLMDEPFAALDTFTRIKMQLLLLNLWQDTKSTVVFVTHDVEEAILLADRIFVMSKDPGKIVSEVGVSFKRPRPLELTETIKFTQLRNNIIKILTPGQIAM